MKNISRVSLTFCTLALYHMAAAQADLQNTGIIFVSGPADVIAINGSLTNTSAAALTNNGNLYVKQNIINGQAAMAVGTGTLYLNGSAAQTVSGTQIFKTFNLVTANTAGIVLNNDLSISGVHTFTDGIITTSATPNYLSYEAGASYSGDGDSRHVNGWVRKTGTTAFSFPVGNGTVERTIAASNLSAASVFTARYAGATTNTGNLLLPLVVVDPYEYWILNRVSGGTANIDMNWDNSKITMPQYALADIRVANYIAAKWTEVGGSAAGNTATTGALSSNVLSSFGAFTLGSISVSLPVNLVQFYARANNNYALISWTTTDEINVGHFELQRSDDGLQFYTIGNVDARNRAALQEYAFADSKILGGLTYYRLRTVDLDGKTKMSKIIAVTNNDPTDNYLSIGNPARNNIHITAKHITGVFEYRINTLAGQTIQQGTIKIAAAGIDIALTPAVKSGLYILQLQKNGFNFTQKLLIQD